MSPYVTITGGNAPPVDLLGHFDMGNVRVRQMGSGHSLIRLMYLLPDFELDGLRDMFFDEGTV